MEKEEKLKKFTEMVSQEIYSEPDSELHNKLINEIIPALTKRPDGPNKTDRIVDIGCGPGLVMEKLVELGYPKENIIGLTKGKTDITRAKEKGFTVLDEDMTFTSFKDDEFDFAIVRHCLEHSPFPYLTLLEFNRILKKGARVYIEMPQPGGDRKLEHMVNHYSIMNIIQWGSLLLRAGFDYTTGVYDLDVSIKEKNYKEPYDWYMGVKLIDRKDFSPANSIYMANLKDNLVKARMDLGHTNVNTKEIPIDKK
jgi:SAM-dependent methyltransferase